jgi:hypothetical protein
MRRETGLHLVSSSRRPRRVRGGLTQHDRAALIVAHDVERVLTDINADYGDCGIELLRHGVLLVFSAPGQLKTLAGQEHGRTIPLADITLLCDLEGIHKVIMSPRFLSGVMRGN